jgi:hypothetical protein
MRTTLQYFMFVLYTYMITKHGEEVLVYGIRIYLYCILVYLYYVFTDKITFKRSWDTNGLRTLVPLF